MTQKYTRFFLLASLFLFTLGCQPEKKKATGNTMIVKGSIEGLRKGTLYLQKIEDTLLVNVDSTLVKGTPNFEFKTPIETPEVFYLYLDKEDGDSLNDRILFFGEKGTIEINTLLKTFESSAEIKGSKNQELLQEHIAFKRKFNDQNLELIQGYYQAQSDGEMEKADSLEQKINNLTRRRYLYTINFAAQHTDQNIAPYLALTEVYDANLSLLDSIAIKMTPEVKDSKYGKELTKFLEQRRLEE
ncbi:MAG: DUF4369 domain-containing protein [Flavobacteriaceae bacterium]|jgi:hypothetical protein|nr:DUF4369 domain-containing protein [Flavobacteriaceae bacterium]MDG1912438.1 DUF4369 domain-containing protein [Flavobacteriaceae bacterium]